MCVTGSEGSGRRSWAGRLRERAAGRDRRQPHTECGSRTVCAAELSEESPRRRRATRRRLRVVGSDRRQPRRERGSRTVCAAGRSWVGGGAGRLGRASRKQAVTDGNRAESAGAVRCARRCGADGGGNTGGYATERPAGTDGNLATSKGAVRCARWRRRGFGGGERDSGVSSGCPGRIDVPACARPPSAAST